MGEIGCQVCIRLRVLVVSHWRVLLDNLRRTQPNLRNMIIIEAYSFQLNPSVLHILKIFVLHHFFLNFRDCERASIIDHDHLLLRVNGMLCLLKFEAETTLSTLWKHKLQQNSMRIIRLTPRIDNLINHLMLPVINNARVSRNMHSLVQMFLIVGNQFTVRHLDRLKQLYFFICARHFVLLCILKS